MSSSTSAVASLPARSCLLLNAYGYGRTSATKNLLLCKKLYCSTAFHVTRKACSTAGTTYIVLHNTVLRALWGICRNAYQDQLLVVTNLSISGAGDNQDQADMPEKKGHDLPWPSWDHSETCSAFLANGIAE